MSYQRDEDRVYPDKWCDVEVVLRDGVIKTHTIKASLMITPYLASQAGQTGNLVLLCPGETICYPLQSIESWRLHNERDRRENV